MGAGQRGSAVQDMCESTSCEPLHGSCDI